MAPYKALGEHLTQLRTASGLQQADIATALNITQQTVSRWEKGVSRPNVKLLQILANVLGTSVNDLMVLAGRAPSPEPALTFVQPFPIWALTPEVFEIFVGDFLTQLYPNAKVHSIGSKGHKQEGTDVEVIFPDGSNHSFQCKRHNAFGPDKVAKAVLAHTWPATQKFIVLSRSASPQARHEIKKSPDWDIWDVDDISRKIRGLSKDAQRRLVDTFFRGQRLALLGEPEPGPWQTAEEFFAAFSARGAFSHAWNLVGRTNEVGAISSALSNPDVRAVLLVGAGGSGKSRILKQVVEAYGRASPSVLVRFVSPGEDVSTKNLDELDDREKVIVVDDAHDDLDYLQLLFQYVGVHSNKAKLLLALRPYGLEYIKAKASNFALVGERLSVTRLDPLTFEQSEQLAAQVLSAFEGPEIAAKDIARLTLDCPLATVVGAQIVAKEKKHLELAKNEDVFRSTFLGKFQDIIAGEIGNKSEADSIKKLLRILALLQPFHPEDESIPQITAKVEGLGIPEVNRLMRLLTDAGVLFKRGGKYRLSPDLLADYVIEQACIGANGISTGYAEEVFDVANNAHIENLLVNLGKLDWRRGNGDPSNSRLLDGIWGKLQPASDYSDPYLRAVTAVAYYQPERALAFAEHLVREQKYLRDLPNLIKYAGYNLQHLKRACECLWELGKGDDRALNQTPEHAVRILSEFCAVEPNRPFDFNKRVVDFGLSLLNQEDSWRHKYSPFDVLKGILQTEGHVTSSNGRPISMSPYMVSPAFATQLRDSVIDATIELLPQTDLSIAVRAARFLRDALRYPIGILNAQPSQETRDRWTDEFIRTLEKIERAISSHDFNSLVLVEIARSVSWHANYASEKTTPIAKRIVASLPNSLEYLTTATLIDGYGWVFGRPDYQERERVRNQHLEELTKALLAAFPDAEQLRSFLAKRIANIQENFIDRNISPHILYWNLVNASTAFASATAQNALLNLESRTTQFAGMALTKLLNENHENGLQVARQFLQANNLELQAAIGAAYGSVDIKSEVYGEDDWAILRELLASADRWVVQNAIGAVRRVADSDPRLAMEQLKCVDLAISSHIADEALMLFQRDAAIPFSLLDERSAQHFLSKLMPIPELDGYWIESFLAELSEAFPYQLAGFFMARVEHAAKEDSWSYRPCNYGPYGHVPLRFRKSSEVGPLVNFVWEWMKVGSENSYHFEHRAGELFETMFRPFDVELVSVIQGWIDSSTLSDMRRIARILCEVPQTFVFEQQEFVIRFLERAKQFGKNILDIAFDALYRASIGGMRHGTPGEPFPEDVNMKYKAETIMGALSRFSPAYKLYEQIKLSAERSIQYSLKERDAFDD